MNAYPVRSKKRRHDGLAEVLGGPFGNMIMMLLKCRVRKTPGTQQLPKPCRRPSANTCSFLLKALFAIHSNARYFSMSQICRELKILERDCVFSPSAIFRAPPPIAFLRSAVMSPRAPQFPQPAIVALTQPRDLARPPPGLKD